jgi:plasmid stabilization system protein ParE
MQFVYVGNAAEDLRWMHRYYIVNFPEGRDRAWQRYLNSLRLLLLNPNIGKPYGSLIRRRHVVPNTPFVIYYDIKPGRLEILRVWDTRRNIENLSFDKTDP